MCRMCSTPDSIKMDNCSNCMTARVAKKTVTCGFCVNKERQCEKCGLENQGAFTAIIDFRRPWFCSRCDSSVHGHVDIGPLMLQKSWLDRLHTFIVTFPNTILFFKKQQLCNL